MAGASQKSYGTIVHPHQSSRHWTGVVQAMVPYDLGDPLPCGSVFIPLESIKIDPVNVSTSEPSEFNTPIENERAVQSRFN